MGFKSKRYDKQTTHEELKTYRKRGGIVNLWWNDESTKPKIPRFVHIMNHVLTYWFQDIDWRFEIFICLNESDIQILKFYLTFDYQYLIMQYYFML